MSQYLLTICIATYNRADCLPATLSCVATQVNNYDDVEVLVVDGNSTDDTESVVREFQQTCRNLRYLKLDEKGGVDKDYDIGVRNASGLYCWLFTDDDLLHDDAIKRVRESILTGAELIVVNAEIYDYHVQNVLNGNALAIENDILMDLSSSGRDQLFRRCATHMTFIGSIVIKKELWVNAPSDKFYGSRFVHVGVISTLSDATRVMILSQPIIKIRLGNAEWTNLSFKVWTQLWPKLIWSFPNLSVECKEAVCLREPWKKMSFLLWCRALGTFSKREYLDFISPSPISVAKVQAFFCAHLPRLIPCAVFYLYAIFRRDRLMLYYLGDGGKSKNAWFSEA